MPIAAIFSLRFGLRVALGLLGLIAQAPQSAAGDLLGRVFEADRARPATLQGPFAGFVATPQVFGFGPPSAILIAPNGHWFASYTNNPLTPAIRLMDMRTGALLRVLETTGGPVERHGDQC